MLLVGHHPGLLPDLLLGLLLGLLPGLLLQGTPLVGRRLPDLRPVVLLLELSPFLIQIQKIALHPFLRVHQHLEPRTHPSPRSPAQHPVFRLACRSSSHLPERSVLLLRFDCLNKGGFSIVILGLLRMSNMLMSQMILDHRRLLNTSWHLSFSLFYCCEAGAQSNSYTSNNIIMLSYFPTRFRPCPSLMSFSDGSEKQSFVCETSKCLIVGKARTKNSEMFIIRCSLISTTLLQCEIPIDCALPPFLRPYLEQTYTLSSKISFPRISSLTPEYLPLH